MKDNIKDNMKTRKRIVDGITVGILTILAFVFMTPIAVVIMNSFKNKQSLIRGRGKAFDLLNKDSWYGFKNYTEGMKTVKIMDAMKNSFIITIVAVLILILLTSMTAWYIVRVKNKLTNALYFLFVFSMVVPFQMVMYTMSNIATNLGLNSVMGIVVLYVGFGAGMCVFMFTGFIKAIPYDVEEAAMIDGCNPLQIFFRVVMPMLKPTMITVAILETMWIWNDFLLPYLTLPSGEIETIPLAIQACQKSHGSIELGQLMAVLVIAIIPIVVFYLLCQKHIIKGVAAGAVKG